VNGFSVTPADLQAFAGVLGGSGGKAGNQQEATGEANRYLSRYATLPPDTSDSLFGRVGLKHQEIMSLVHQGFSNSAVALGGSAQSLIEVAQYYQSTDEANAAMVDATIPHTQTFYQGYNFPDPTLTGLPDAADQLVAPQVPANYPDPLEPIRNVLNVVTGSGFVEAAVTALLGWNPYERAGVLFGGDWRAFGQAGYAFGSAGKCAEMICENMQRANDAVAKTWHGNAATAAHYYFVELSDDINCFGGSVAQLQVGYEELAASAYLASEGIADLLHSLTDDVAIAGLALGGGLTPAAANRLVHLLPEFVKSFLAQVGLVWGLMEILDSLGHNIQATNDIRTETGNVEQPAAAPYTPPKQLVH
jgi:uncharacterized protein YukE